MFAILCALAGRAEAASLFPITELSLEGRGASMGGSDVAMPASAQGLWRNPASVGELDSFDLHFSHAQWIGDSAGEFISIAAPWNSARYLVTGAYAGSLKSNDIFRDEAGVEGARFDVSSSLWGLAQTIRVGPVTWGGAVKVIDTVVAQDYWRSPLLFDMATRVYFERLDLQLALVAQNFPTFDTDFIDLAKYRAGLAHTLTDHGLTLGLAVETSHGQSVPFWGAGLEWAKKMSALQYALRLGWESSRLDLGGLSGMVAGAELRVGALRFDLTWAPMSILGDSWRAGFGWSGASSREPYIPPPHEFTPLPEWTP